MKTKPCVDVVPLLPVDGRFSYAWRGARPIASAVGFRIEVPFGGRKVVGIVVGASPPEMAATKLKVAGELLDDEPAFSQEMLAFLQWSASYYFAPLGDLLRAALPTALARGVRRVLSITVEGREALAAQDAILRRAEYDLASDDLALLRRLADGGRLVLGRDAARRKSGSRLAERGLVVSSVELPRSRPRTDLEITLLAVTGQEREKLLVRAPRQAALLEQFLATGASVLLLNALPDRPSDARAICRKLEAKGLLELREVEVRSDPFAAAHIPEDTDHILTAEQAQALDALLKAARSARLESSSQLQGAATERGRIRPRGPEGEATGSAFLLHGVTGSGKTELYLRLIADITSRGRSALVMVPEIALTPQLAGRFRARFGDKVAVLHSGLTDAARYDQWRRIRRGELPIVVGARSAVFAPLPALGAVIIDEEHDSSFKQDEGVRYNGRDLALLRAHRQGAVAVLGSATPSLESIHGVDVGRLQLLSLKQRATARRLPPVDVIDLRVHSAGKDGVLSGPLAAALQETLDRGEQAIVFLNRRGFSPFVQCRGCGHAFRCESCSVTLTHHRRQRRLVCHYCGHSDPMPERCPKCSGGEVAQRGVGTEKVESVLLERFPRARIARMDRDTATGAALEQLLNRIQRRELDIVVGTQMVTKGHDFPHVTLVGVLAADQGLHFPDFRAGERTFQLLTQVAGRAGRGERPGRVIVQCYDPNHPVIVAAQKHDFEAFCKYELRSRKELSYPPFSHAAVVHLSGESEAAVVETARTLARLAERADDSQVSILGPTEAPIQRIKGRTRWMMLLKSPRRQPLRRLLDRLRRLDTPASVRLVVDIDPVHML